MSARPAIAFALGLAAVPAFAESGQEWLTRMGAALNNASYVGEFVSESAGRTERLAITHRVRDGVVSERLVSLQSREADVLDDLRTPDRRPVGVACALQHDGHLRIA